MAEPSPPPIPGRAEHPLDAFMSVVAHDLRNPIAIVRASGQMALRKLDRDDLEGARRRLQAVIEQTDRLTDLLEGFVEAARLETHRLPLRFEEFDLGTLVREAVEQARASVGSEHCVRQVALNVQSSCVVSVDRVRMVRAIRSLIENALVYGSHDDQVCVVVESRDGKAIVRVTGGGTGPTLEEGENLFQLFYRGNAAAEAGHAGSGLGLYNARGIVRAHGGDVRPTPDIEADAFELEVPLPR